MSRLCLRMLCIAFLVGWITPAWALSLETGNDAYQRGDYEAAIEAYEALIADGVVHEDLYYNLGNAHYRDGRLGEAIFNYERALRVASGQGDAEYNLSVAREAVAAGSQNQLLAAEEDSWWVRLSLSVSLAESTLVLLLCNFLFFVALIALRFLVPGFTRTIVVVLSVFLGTAALSSALLLAGHIYANEKIHHGVITADRVVMREGPDVELEERGQLQPGLRVTVLAREPQWLLIRLANGVEGWVPRAAVGLFR